MSAPRITGGVVRAPYSLARVRREGKLVAIMAIVAAMVSTIMLIWWIGGMEFWR